MSGLSARIYYYPTIFVRQGSTSAILVAECYRDVSHNPTHRPITCQIDGKTYRGSYWIAAKILVVSTGMGGKSKQVGSTPAEILAEQLLHELSKEGKA